MISNTARVLAGGFSVGMLTLLASDAPPPVVPVRPTAESAVLARLAEIQAAAEALDPDKVFSFVLENDHGALVQNGVLLRTRAEALAATRQGFGGLQQVSYRFNQQHVSFLSPTIALVVGEGSSSATVLDGRILSNQFAQSVVLVATNGGWKVLHAHRSFPAVRTAEADAK